MPINPIPIDENKDATELKKVKKEIDFQLSDPIFTFDDVILPKKVEDEIQEILALNTHKTLVFETWGLQRVLKRQKNISVNFYGESGTGKTITAHAMANSLGKKLLIVNYSEIESKYVGETAKNLERLFDFARGKDVIILFDEADALLSKRVTSMNNATDVSVNQTRNVLLKLLDTYEGMILFTTNFIENYDKAFFRRIINHIKFELPDFEMRKKLWEHYLVSELPVEGNREEIIEYLSQTEGVSGSDISTVVLKTAIHAALKKERQIVEKIDFEAELKKIINMKHILNADNFTIETKKVSEEYVKEKLGRGERSNGIGRDI